MSINCDFCGKFTGKDSKSIQMETNISHLEPDDPLCVCVDCWQTEVAVQTGME